MAPWNLRQKSQPQAGIRRHAKARKRPVRPITLLVSQLKRADGLLARGRREVKRLRALKLDPSTTRLSRQVLANLEALLALQIAHRGYLVQQLEKAKSLDQRKRRTRKAAKKAVVSDAGRRSQRTRTTRARR